VIRPGCSGGQSHAQPVLQAAKCLSAAADEQAERRPAVRGSFAFRGRTKKSKATEDCPTRHRASRPGIAWKAFPYMYKSILKKLQHEKI